MPDLTPQVVQGPFSARLTPPGSKSITNRALVLAALARGRSTLRNVLFADDTSVMIDSLAKLGFRIDIDRDAKCLTIDGHAGTIPATRADCFCGNSGTTVRFLIALATLGSGAFRFDGIARLRERPVAPLLRLLRNLGARFSHEEHEGKLPLTVLADGLPGGFVRVGAESSSQYLSALLMSAPHARHELRVDLEGPQTSWPYVAMTMRLMDEFGVLPEVTRDPLSGLPVQISVPLGTYDARDYPIEPDASAASYFAALGALHDGCAVRIEGLDKHSLQGDVEFASLLRRMGAKVTHEPGAIVVEGTGELEGIEADLERMPDVAQTLAVVALFARGPTVMRGLSTLRVKETDRIEALRVELSKLGARVEVEGDESMTIHPPARVRADAIDTYDDHRMAMSFALASTRVAGVTIRDAQCVNKTYPEFFSDLARATSSRNA